jgi:carbon monoxide dehydrogenase subunit G
MKIKHIRQEGELVMKIKVQIPIEGSPEEIWKVITDIENSPEVISGIDKIEILEQPKDGLVGLKWEETRTLFGRTATEIMWITDTQENQSYQTRADGPGVVYISRFDISEENGESILAMSFEGQSLSVGSRIMAAIMGVFFNSATKKAMEQDLQDIKAAVELNGRMK